jgi:histidyl-tRNA synthetase
MNSKELQDMINATKTAQVQLDSLLNQFALMEDTLEQIKSHTTTAKTNIDVDKVKLNSIKSDTIKASHIGGSKAVMVIKDGEQMHFSSLKRATTALGIPNTSIYDMLRRGDHNYKDMTFYYINDKDKTTSIVLP